MEELPIARNPDQRFMAGVCERLDRQNQLLADIRDRLPTHDGGQPVTAAATGEVTEPARPAVTPPQATTLTEPATPPNAAAVKKPAPKKSTSPRRARAAEPKAKES
ncbi:hypothetical protein [Spirillospora sp. CA-294931]|uniref:hypothetical protein n=1 Tax=Spirillospora sp. CA-294931 TaxID=3240042 RepID=UPI003D8BF445